MDLGIPPLAIDIENLIESKPWSSRFSDRGLTADFGCSHAPHAHDQLPLAETLYLSLSLYIFFYIHVYIYIYIYMYTHICIYIYIIIYTRVYIHVYGERERERDHI